MIYIAIFILLIIVIPKHNKAEKEAGHLFIDTYNVPVKKIRNPVRQMFKLEKQFNIKGIRSYQLKTLAIIGGAFFGGLALILIGAYMIVELGKTANIVVMGLLIGIGTLILFVGTIYTYIRLFKIHAKIRPQTWGKLLQQVDPKLDTTFLQNKNWQKALLVVLVENKD
ncbi:hypothetical protein ACWOFR_06150 [Carnobacterium gallinarum]|uniref:hypothetical protein n=1 Tax=Carnobacterium gallinarum TaxID=2749 RepID=UPI0005535EA4|nr:hypothetical protein [Carnobacterium gallinarum]